MQGKNTKRGWFSLLGVDMGMRGPREEPTGAPGNLGKKPLTIIRRYLKITLLNIEKSHLTKHANWLILYFKRRFAFFLRLF